MNTVKPKIKFEKENNSYGKVVLSPLLPGMGTTIGNSLRRVLLSSLDGAGITWIKIQGVSHEFENLPEAVEDVLEIIANFKGIVFNTEQDSKVLSLNFKGKGVVKASHITADKEVEIVNPDHFLFELSNEAEVNIEFCLSKGYGYVSAEQNQAADLDIETIFVDTSFSPVIRVNPVVEKIRVGRDLGFDQLTVDVWTDGSLDVESAIKKATDTLMQNFLILADLTEVPVYEYQDTESTDENSDVLNITIDELELSARSLNCLKKAGIHTVDDLIKKDYEELANIKNFGKKSADEINAKLIQYGVSMAQQA